MSSIDARARLGLALSASAALLAACSTAPLEPVNPAIPLTPTEQYSIQVRQAPDQLALAPHAEGLSANQREAVAAFAARWRENGRADISIRTPADAEPQAVSRMVADLTNALQAQGVPAQQLRMGPYDAGAPGGPVLASFLRYEAQIPNCEEGWDNLSSTGNNGPSTHYGCAVTANLGAMIADPRDLVGPAAAQAADSSRRQVVIDRYRAGQTTSSARDSQAVGSVSGGAN
jgi:pilus assembly protein CpaD